MALLLRNMTDVVSSGIKTSLLGNNVGLGERREVRDKLNNANS